MRTLLLASVFTATSLLSFAQGPDHVPGEVLVRLKAIAHEADLRSELSKALPAAITLKEVKALGPKSRYSKLSMAGTGMSDQELEKLVARLPGVEATSLNYKVKHLAEANDAQYGTQWNLEDINVEPVWDVTTGGTMANGMRIGVALSDLAIQTNHPDLSGNIWPNSPSQGNGEDHGTEVASVLGAVGNNNIGIAGVNWDVEIFSSGETEDLSDGIEQFEAATSVREQFNASNGANGLCVVSITASWGIENAGTCNGFTEPLFSDMTAAGILLVASGPNEPVSIEAGTDFPANCALAEHLVVTSYGPNNETPFAFGPNTVHLLAPGVDIPVATVPSTYAVTDGNSFAVPTVAGAIALLYSIPCPTFAQLVMDDPVAAREQVKNAVLNNTAPFPGGSALTITGGKLDVHAAYQALMSACSPSCTDYTITLTTTGDPVTSWSITDVDNTVILTGGGNTITTCLDDGCYTINLLGANSLPMEADFVVENLEGVVTSGNSSGGIIQFGVGVQIPGCTIVGSGNYDPQANCNDGSCCAGEMLRVIFVPEDFQTEGTAEMVVTSNGSVLFSGPIDIVFDAEFGVPVGSWQGCAPDGCFSVQVSNPSMPLSSDGFVFLNGDLGNPESFPISTGYSAAIGGAVGPEVCDGLDNDCDGAIDEDFFWYDDADGDGFGSDASVQMSCTPLAGHVQVGGDCDDGDVNITVPGQACDDGNPATSNDQVTASCECLGSSGNCPPGEVQDCNGNCAPAEWIGDGICDAGGFEYNGVGIVFNCAEFELDGGDCADCVTEVCDGLDNDCDGTVDENCELRVAVKVFLGGGYNSSSGLMNDGLRVLGLIPTAEPYTGLGYLHVNGGGEVTSPAVLAVSGNNAVVDWVVLELRDALDPSSIGSTRSALVQRDGDVVDVDGLSPVSFAMPLGNFHVALRHRNHLGIMTGAPITLSSTASFINLTLPGSSIYGGATATFALGGVRCLWPGDVNGDGQIQYSGTGNDKDPIAATAGPLPTSVGSGYAVSDVNMDGKVKFTGTDNDRDRLLRTLGGMPAAVRADFLP